MASLDTSKANSSLPIISLTSPNLAKELYTACLEHGFFYLTDHGVAPSILENILDLARRFFLQSSAEDKASIKRRPAHEGGDSARGYQVLNENITKGLRDFQEAVDLYKQFDDTENSISPLKADYDFLRGPNLWPSHPPELKTVYEQYIDRCKKVGAEVIRAMGEALQLSGEERDALTSSTDNSFWVMRMIGYPPLQNEADEQGVSCGEHTDYGCVTLLLADSTKGALQVQLKDGSWINADPIPGAFVVNIGDMIERWTNGEWRSTKHRVIHRGPNYRISVPFFFEPNFDAEIKPLQKCIERTGGHPVFQSIVYGDHLTAKVKANYKD
ncbi:naringenin 2-oxoglutarate 3-dioxygenase [Venturia nashicola]|uniref:Naringenin 2-oxoglutarate 3-dioxygenase n=1 Tax=Venturia nashicola TaxID=86259 RepID=A0A4Z1NHK2_9PEZI|nr:naringenin 2-oxoglutarate 3-dioxygenase [Venturia nashicola]